MKGRLLAGAASAALLLGIAGVLLVVVADWTPREGPDSLAEVASGSAVAEGRVGPDVDRSGAAAVPGALGSVYPLPETVRSFDLVPPGWHNSVWTGPSVADPGTALDCIADDYAIAYRLESDQTCRRYVSGRTDLSSKGAVNRYESPRVLITDSGAQCVGMPVEP